MICHNRVHIESSFSCYCKYIFTFLILGNKSSLRVQSHDAIFHPTFHLIFTSNSLSTKTVIFDHLSWKQSRKIYWKSDCLRFSVHFLLMRIVTSQWLFPVIFQLNFFNIIILKWWKGRCYVLSYDHLINWLAWAGRFEIGRKISSRDCTFML